MLVLFENTLQLMKKTSNLKERLTKRALIIITAFLYENS
jgi:hypothetical protein